MVTLPTVPNAGPALTTAPQSRVTSKDIESVGNAEAGALDSGANAADDAAVPFAQAEAQADAQKMISRDANGNLQVQDVAPRAFVGHAGQVYTQTAQMAYQANLQTQLHNQFQTLASKTMLPADQGGGGGDPQWFQRQAAAVVNGLASSARGGLQFPTQQMGQDLAGQYFRSLVGQRTAMDGQQAKSTFDARATMLQTDLSDLASQGGTGTPEFQQKAAELDALRRQKLADPRMGYTQAQYDDDVRSDHTNQQVQAVVGSARKQAEASGDYFTAIRTAEEALQSIPMDPMKRIHALGQVTSHLGSAASIRGQQLKELTDAAGAMETEIYDQRQVNDGALNEMVAKLTMARAYGPAMRLEAARRYIQAEPAILQGTAQQAADTAKAIFDAAKNGGAAPVTGVATAYGPNSADVGNKTMEGGPNDATGKPVATLEDWAGGKAQRVTIAGAPAFQGRQYTIPSITWTDRNGTTRTDHDVPVEVRDTGARFAGAPEGRFDIPAFKDASADQLSSQPYSKQNLQFLPDGKGSGLASGKMTPANWSLQFYRPEDMLPPTGNRQVDARAATMADQLGQQFFNATGIRVPINDVRPGWKPGDATEGMRRGTADPSDNPHVEHSQHLDGKAFDFQVQNLSPDQKSQFLTMARQIGFTGVGFYEGGSGHLHLDAGPARSWGGQPDWASQAMAVPPGSGPASVPPLAAEGYKQVVTHTQAAVNGRTEQLWGGMTKAWDAGQQPTAQEIADLKTLLPLVSKPELRQSISTRLFAQVAVADQSSLPALQQQDLAAAAKLSAQSGHLGAVEREVANRLQQAAKERSDLVKDDPVSAASVYKGLSPVPGLNFSSHDAFKGSLSDRQTRLGVTKQSEPTAGDNPLTKTDREQIASTLPNLKGDQAFSALQAMNSTFKPEQMLAVLQDDKIKGAIMGLARSGDPAKMQAAYSFLDSQNRTNPMTFAATWGQEAEHDLHTWQASTQFQPADVAAKQMMEANDPSTARAVKERNTAAEDLLKPITADQVLSKIQTHPWLSWIPGSGLAGIADGAPVSDTAAMSPDEVLADYRESFRDDYARSGDKTSADKYARDQVAKKWGVSAANNGRLMAYPPEKYVQPVDGDQSWIGKQLDADLKSFLGPMGTYQKGNDFAPGGITPTTDAEAKALGQYEAPRALVADQKTIADISAGRPPSYRVIIQDQNGRFHALDDGKGGAWRWHPDREAELAVARDRFIKLDKAWRTDAADREAWFQRGSNGAAGQAAVGMAMGGGG